MVPKPEKTYDLAQSVHREFFVKRQQEALLRVALELPVGRNVHDGKRVLLHLSFQLRHTEFLVQEAMRLVERADRLQFTRRVRERWESLNAFCETGGEHFDPLTTERLGIGQIQTGSRRHRVFGDEELLPVVQCREWNRAEWTVRYDHQRVDVEFRELRFEWPQ